jgi:hypothetical protein
MVVVGDEGNSGDIRKISKQMIKGVDLAGGAAVNREEYGIDGPFSDNSNSFGNRVPMHHRETAVTGGVHPLALSGEEHGGDGMGGARGSGRCVGHERRLCFMGLYLSRPPQPGLK